MINLNNTGWNHKQQPNKVARNNIMVLLHQFYFGDNIVCKYCTVKIHIKIMVVQQSEKAPLRFPMQLVSETVNHCLFSLPTPG